MKCAEKKYFRQCVEILVRMVTIIDRLRELNNLIFLNKVLIQFFIICSFFHHYSDEIDFVVIRKSKKIITESGLYNTNFFLDIYNKIDVKG